MQRNGQFADYDDEKVYEACRHFSHDGTTKNFVIEFGRDKAQVAFDLRKDDFDTLLNTKPSRDLPIRWINIWGPHMQMEEAEMIGEHFGFSARLRAIIRTYPEFEDKNPNYDKQHWRVFRKEDVELGPQSPVLPKSPIPPQAQHEASHYSIVKQMENYHAIDFGENFICIGANWMHEQKPKLKQKQSTAAMTSNLEGEGKQRRLYSWLVLCSDNTVISLHEHPGTATSQEDLDHIRANLLSVFSQLSKLRGETPNPISMQAVRQALDPDKQKEWGLEGASNLFYYLFDDWRAVYHTVAVFQKRLKDLQTQILNNTSRKSVDTVDLEIIPRLHILGGRIRSMQHVYEGYKNLIQRVLEPPKVAYHDGSRSPTSPSSDRVRFSQLSGRQGPPLARSAISRFERLGDRLQLLILSQTKELLAEKDALTGTYFNINAQKDSEATARLTRAAGLLAKLSVLFLPVSLMTSYFSIQISDLQGVYTVNDYWYSFAIIMSISFLFLFFFSRLLMWITETLDNGMKKTSRMCKKYLENIMWKSTEE